jgi:hypothetical protein
MPVRPLSPCKISYCSGRAVYHGYCNIHKRNADTRLSSSARGYGIEWRKIREGVLRAYRIPVASWPLYDIHHTPVYNAAIEPDHSKYRLIPMLHSEHSRETDGFH